MKSRNKYVTASHMMKKFCGVCAFMLLLFSLSGCGKNNSSKDVSEAETAQENGSTAQENSSSENHLLPLKVATDIIPGNYLYNGLLLFQDTVENRDGDRLDVQLYPGEQLGSENIAVEGLQNGNIEMAFLPIGVMENTYTEITELMPVFSDMDLDGFKTLFSSPQSRDILSGMQEATGVRCLATCVIGMNNLWTKEEIHTPEDLNGLRIQVINTPLHVRSFEALGAIPSTISFSQVHDGLKAGILDGTEQVCSAVENYNLAESCRFCLQTEHSAAVYAFFISDEVYNLLESKEQRMLQEICSDMAEKMQEDAAVYEAVAEEKLAEKGVTFYEIDTPLGEG